jgi:hypothetical protein
MIKPERPMSPTPEATARADANMNFKIKLVIGAPHE